MLRWFVKSWSIVEGSPHDCGWGTNNQMFASPPISKICSTHICRNNSKQGNKLPREQHLHICINSFYSLQRNCKKKSDSEQQFFNDVNLCVHVEMFCNESVFENFPLDPQSVFSLEKLVSGASALLRGMH